MSYWGITVMINIVAVLPCCGIIIAELIGGSIGFGLSIILRLELALPGFILCSPLQYNSNITFYGIFMTSSMIMSILI